MPKSLTIDPERVCGAQVVRITDIPVNQYVPEFERERERYGLERLRGVYRDMVMIREFETMLSNVKTQGRHRGIECRHLGPAHLSIGQEAAAVGQCLVLDADDFIFGSHRSHGEVLAKCFASLSLFDDEELLGIMRGYGGGGCLRVVEKGHDGDVRELAESFTMYGVLAEILGRANGFNRGLGGSMHVFFPPFGSMPNNAIVGGSGDIAVGAALYKRINRRPGIVIANMGDAALGCGPVWEAMMLASMEQYTTLWDKGLGGAPPVLFNFFNNFYGMGGQTDGETMGFQVLARAGAGVNPHNLHAERVNGYNPLAVADAVERKKRVLIEGLGPALLDVVTYRLSGHSPSDASSYRSREELERWRQVDCIRTYGDYLERHHVLSGSEREAIQGEAEEKVERALRQAASLETSPRVDPEVIGAVTYSNGRRDRLSDETPELLGSREDNARVKALGGKARYGLDEAGVRLAASKVYSVRDGLFEAMMDGFQRDPTLVAYGEENRDWGGAFAVYRGLTEMLPYHRLFNTSISEGAIVGSGAGYALSGGRAVVEIMYCDFLGRAGDELFNQVAKWQAMSGGVLRMPLVVRVSVGRQYGAQHSQDWTAMVAHVPGLKAMYPVTPYDAKGMLTLALRGTDPVVLFESQKTYDLGEYFVAGGVPVEPYEIPEGEPVVRRAGSDLTLIGLGPAMYKALEAADELRDRHGIAAEVIDLRFINPLNYEPLVASVRKTGRVVLVGDACERGSFLNDVATNLTQLVFDDLDGPPAVVGARNWITPAAEMEPWFYPGKEWILDTIHQRVLPLEGHEVTSSRTLEELVRRHRSGV
jgi:2-oxoisovalerate dehydrogenase E1 component